MRIVALECSSPRHSVALLEDGAVVAEKQWDTTPRGGQRLFDRLEELLAEAEIKAADVELWVTGSGPGNFSGMRVSMAAVKAFGLATVSQIEAVSSGEALAMAWMKERGESSVGIVGDARRGHLWYGNCQLVGEVVEVQGGWKLCDYVDMAGHLEPDKPILSSESERVHAALEKAGLARMNLEEPVFPCAASLGLLAHKRLQAGLSFDSMIPNYMHDAI